MSAINPIPQIQPEKLNLWDRFFNRHKKEIRQIGFENWFHISGDTGKRTDYRKNFVEYYVIDRLTGSVTVEKEYLN